MNQSITAHKENRVTIHAVQRYLERVMKVELDKDGYIAPAHIIHVQKLITTELLEKYPNAMEVGKGEFVFKEENYKMCMVDGYITTIKNIVSEDSSRYVGGITRSGKNTKKVFRKQLREHDSYNHNAYIGE